MTEQPLFDLPDAPVPIDVADLLQLIAGDPVHARDRKKIVQAIVAEAAAHGGLVDPNRLRARLADEHGRPTVYPRVVGAVVSCLAQRRAIEPAGYVKSTDRHGKNAGRPARVWRLRAQAVAA